MNNQLCPVCGYNLGFEAWRDNSPSDEICPSCGIQFGYDDMADNDEFERKKIHKKWREKWIESGMKWYSKRPIPEDWDPEKQLKKLNL